jgi:hypothetical protein
MFEQLVYDLWIPIIQGKVQWGLVFALRLGIHDGPALKE